MTWTPEEEARLMAAADEHSKSEAVCQGPGYRRGGSYASLPCPEDPDEVRRLIAFRLGKNATRST
jgi:hypothetical protein